MFAIGTSLMVRTHRAAAGARMTTLPLTSTFLIGSRRSMRLIERNLFVYRHGWLIILSGFFEPLFYLLSIGFGLGALIGTCRARTASRSATSCSWRRPCSRAPR